jgi:hypothetical protein
MILLAASIGTVAAIVNPPRAKQLVQQGAAILGLEIPFQSAESVEESSDEDRLSQFLAEYPFADRHQDSVSTTSVPTVAIPGPSPPPIPQAYPVPISEPVAPAYARSWDEPHWNGADPIPVSPAEEYGFGRGDTSGSPQTFQEPLPVYQQSVYAPPPPPPVQTEIFPVVYEVPHFEQTSYIPSPPLPSPPTTMPAPPESQVEDVPVLGTELAARVGTQFILMGDILPKLRRMALQMIAENIKRMSEEERAKATPQEIEGAINTFIARSYTEALQEQIIFALVYSDYEFSQDRASKNMFNERLGEEFDRTEVPDMMKEFNVGNIAALKEYLQKQLGSSYEKEKRLWIREQIVKQWIGMSVQKATGECTYDEMMDFYQANKTMFTSVARARWQEMVVLLSQHNTEQEAWDKIRWMGNQTAGGAPFEEIAKANSDGFTAVNGGVWDWITKGSLSSAELEQAVFSQPIGQLSPAVIVSDKGLHIIRVLERQETKVVPFEEAQGTIREKIKNQRAQRYQEEYLTDLRRRFPPLIVKDHIDCNVSTKVPEQSRR